MKQVYNRFPFWVICILVLIGAAFVGGWSGSLITRLKKGAPVWKEMPGPSSERIVAILDAEITILKEQRLCVQTKRGGVFLWREYNPAFEKLNPDGAQPSRHWRQLKPLPDGQEIKQLIVSPFDSDEKRPLVVVKSENDQTYGWLNEDWHPFEKITEFGIDWPRAWPSDGETTLQLVIQTNNPVSTKPAFPSGGKSKQQREFRSWFPLPKPPGEVVDETKVSFEGSLSWWVSSYVLLEDGRLLVLVAETDFTDAIPTFAGVVIGLLVGIVVVVILGIRRRRANARRTDAVTS